MKVVTTFDELLAARSVLPGPVGLVPTMGYLHKGHISLVEAAHKDCASVVVSIFVNPTQFSPTEDLAAYPRDLPRDLAMLDQSGTDIVWTPTADVMYPTGFQTWVEVADLTKPLEGAMRPTHFRGVTTVVAKLFNAVRPDFAYFGQKDAQQAAVLTQMARDLSYPIQVVVCPIVREPDGLALSSRNKYLEPEQRRAAVVLSQSLNAARAAFESGERNVASLRKVMMDILEAEPLAKVQYVSFADPLTLQELEGVSSRMLISMAVYFGRTRLIDNLILG
jgi:pantoate--beta-alanine ligase